MPAASNTVRLISSVTTDTVNQRTLITWADGDGLLYDATPGSTQTVYALRQRAALFGFNAVNPLMLAKKTQEELENLKLIQSAGSGTLEWNFSEPGGPGSGVVDLDAVYAKVTAGGYLALILPDGSGSGSLAGTVTVGQIASVTTVSRSDYGVSAKITRATLWVGPRSPPTTPPPGTPRSSPRVSNCPRPSSRSTTRSTAASSIWRSYGPISRA